MFIIFDKESQLIPIKIWLDDISQIDDVCKQQAINLSNIPYAHKWVSLMPDTHQGYGMPIGGVIALKNIIIPNAVGVDIGCGMIFLQTNINTDDISSTQRDSIIKKIQLRIPVGFKHRQQKIEDEDFLLYVQKNEEDIKKNYTLFSEIEESKFQIGTLGGGNHFIELQNDENKKLTIMVHSGSRNFGYKIANFYNDKANMFCKKNNNENAVKKQIAHLMVESEVGQSYISWMNLALFFAQKNRQLMMEIIKEILCDEFKDIKFENEINAHHNYASYESHFGEDVWVHRKGAIHVPCGEFGIIPGAMGSYSYIVKGNGALDSFLSCSHGAGRNISRKQAQKIIKKEDVMKDLESQGVKIGIQEKSVLVDESRFVYKDIEFVIDQQQDLCTPIKKMKSIMVVKG